MTTTKRIDLAIDALINDNSAEALGHLMLYKMEQIEEIKDKPLSTTTRHTWNQEPDLPPIKPINTGKRPDTKGVTCPTCGAKPGKPCVEMTARGQYGKPTDKPRTGYHKPRLAKAKEQQS